MKEWELGENCEYLRASSGRKAKCLNYRNTGPQQLDMTWMTDKGCVQPGDANMERKDNDGSAQLELSKNHRRRTRYYLE